jgi:hypothetical protein
MKLYDIAHSRTGDKGDISIISLITYEPQDYELIKEKVTAAKVKEWFQELGTTTVDRYELPNLHALNFVLDSTLGGGVTRSLAVDMHGKSLSSALLEMEI